MFEGWIEWDKMMAEKAARQVTREHVPMFEEFQFEEKQHRDAVWKDKQSYTPPTTDEPGFRGWLEGKPNPVLPDDAALFPRQDMASASGTKLADMFPGAVPGTTYKVPDASLDPVPRCPSHTDRPSAYPASDKGITHQSKLTVGSTLWPHLFRATPVVV